MRGRRSQVVEGRTEEPALPFDFGSVFRTYAAYQAAVLLLTWPLAANLTTHLPDTAAGCRFDSLVGAWVLAHISRNLLHPCLSCLTEANIYHPAPHTLFYSPTGLGALPAFAPVFLLTGNPTLAINFVVLFGIASTAAALHLVVAAWTRSHWSAIVSSSTFLATRWVLWDWLPPTPWFAALAYFPLIIFLSARRNAPWSLVFLVTMQCLTDPVYVAPAVLAPLAGIALWRILGRSARRAGAVLLVGMLTAVVVLGVTNLGHIALELKQSLANQSIWTMTIVPPDLPVDLLRSLSPLAIPTASWIVVFAAIVGYAISDRSEDRVSRTASAHAIWWSIAGLLLAIPPVVELFGDRTRVFPHWWIAQVVPSMTRIRVPIRLGVAALFGLSILAGLGFDFCSKRIKPGRWFSSNTRTQLLAVVVVAAIYAEYRSGLPNLRPPIPLRYPIQEAIGPPAPAFSVLQQPGRPLLELPLHPYSIWPEAHANAMYRSIFHRRRLVNGYTSYFPNGYLERMALAVRLPESAALSALILDTDLELVLVHADELDAVERSQWDAVLSGKGDPRLGLIASDGSDWLFRIDPGAGP